MHPQTPKITNTPIHHHTDTVMELILITNRQTIAQRTIFSHCATTAIVILASGISLVGRSDAQIELCPLLFLADYASRCGIHLMPAVYQVVGFGRGDGRHSGRQGRSVVSSVKGGLHSVTNGSIHER